MELDKDQEDELFQTELKPYFQNIYDDIIRREEKEEN